MSRNHVGVSEQEFNRIRDLLKAQPAGDICWRCGLKIDLECDYNDPQAWTADHVQSLANGGDAYALSNLRPAHRSCNSKRGRAMRDTRSSRVWL